jgi:small subunit ribosomal protein S29
VPQKRGAILGSISSTQTTNPIPLELRDTLNLEYLDKRPISPYEKRNQILLDYASGLKSLEVPAKLSLEEAAGIFEVWKGVKAFGRSKPFISAILLILTLRYFCRGIPV